jgi:hypothetical protein
MQEGKRSAEGPFLTRQGGFVSSLAIFVPLRRGGCIHPNALTEQRVPQNSCLSRGEFTKTVFGRQGGDAGRAARARAG